jgi:hypothetical protein
MRISTVLRLALPLGVAIAGFTVTISLPGDTAGWPLGVGLGLILALAAVLIWEQVRSALAIGHDRRRRRLDADDLEIRITVQVRVRRSRVPATPMLRHRGNSGEATQSVWHDADPQRLETPPKQLPGP